MKESSKPFKFVESRDLLADREKKDDQEEPENKEQKPENKEQEPESEGQQEPGEKENGVSIIFTPPQKKSAALKQSSKPFKFVESRDILADREKKDEQEEPENKEQEPESEGQQEPGKKENGVSIIFTPPQKKSAAMKESSKPFKFVESRDLLADREKKDDQEEPE